MKAFYYLVPLLLMALLACNDDTKRQNQSRGDGEDQKTTRIPIAGDKNKLDVLLVLDHTIDWCSNIDELYLVDSIGILLHHGIDFKIAMTSSDPDQTERFIVPNEVVSCAQPPDEQLLDCRGTPTVLKSAQYRQKDGRLDWNKLHNDLKCLVLSSPGGANLPMPLSAAQKALTPTNSASDFLREEALLTISFVSRGEDCSYEGEGNPFEDVEGPDPEEKRFLCNWYPEHLTPTEYYADFFEALKENPSHVHITSNSKENAEQTIIPPGEPHQTSALVAL